MRGGLSYVLIGAMYLVSGISGSKIADMAAIAPVLFPEMKKRGAKPGDLVALLSATGAQTETIPPSIVLITIGSVTGVSIAALFTGGMLPAVVLGAVPVRRGLVALPQRRPERRARATARGRSARCCVVALPAVLLPFVIRAAVVEGVATATEVSTIGIVYSVLVGLLVYRQFDWQRLGPMLVETASLIGRHHLHRRLRHRHGLGPDAVGLLAEPGAAGWRAIPGGALRLPGRLDRRLHRAGQRARGHPGDRAVRAAAVPASPRRPACTRCTTRWW